MQLPKSIAPRLFRLIYPVIHKSEGNQSVLIRRWVTRVDSGVAKEFDRIFDASLDGQAGTTIEYDLPFPKIDFLNYLCDWRGMVAHGTNLNNLTVLEPIRKSSDTTEFGNRRQIFCSPDATWAMWFAILYKTRYRATRNGCIGIGTEARREKYYHFELPRDLKDQFPFSSGALYLLRATDFPSRHRMPVLNFFGGDFEEWGSAGTVTPLAKIRVEPVDFPYLDQVEYCL